MHARSVPVRLRFQMLAAALALVASASCTRGPAEPKTLDIFVLAPLTGPGATLGEYIRNGVEIGRTEIEAEHGSEVRLNIEFLDSKNQPREGVSAFEAAKALRRPDALIMAMSSVSTALAPIVEGDRIFTVATTTAVTGLPQGKEHVVRIYPTSEDFVAPTAELIAARHTAPAIFYVNDDFGRSNRSAWIAFLETSGVKPRAEETFELTQTDHRNSIAKVLASRPDSIFVTGYGPAYVALLTQIREAVPSLPLYTEMSIGNPAVLAALGAAADGIVFAGTDLELSEPTGEAAKSFKAEYHRRFGKDTFMVAGFARDSLRLIVEASLSGSSGEPRPPAKTAAISLSPFNGSVGTIRLDQYGESRIPLRLMRREGGRTVLLGTGVGE